MADARSEEELAATAHQLDAFHKTFNFCLTCRQYTCGECWNVAEGRCLTCAPIEGLEAPATHAHVAMAPGLVATNGHDVHADDDLEPDLWPEADLSQDRLARALGTDAPVADAIEDEVPTQLEVDAAADAFDTPGIESTEGMTVDEAWMAAAAAEADASEARDVRLPAPEPDAVVADAVDATAEAGAPEDVVAADLVDEDAPIAAAAMAAGFADDDAGPSMSALEAEEEADFEARASAAEQDATAEAVMDPALDFDLDDAGAGVEGVAPGQSLEEAIAAYEARLAAEEAEAAGHADDHPVSDVAAVAAIAAVTEPDAPVADAPVAAEPVAEEAAAVAEAPVDLVVEPVAEAPAAVAAEPLAADVPVEAADVAIVEPAVVAADDDHLLAAAALTAAVVDEPVAAPDEPDHDHAIGAAALAAAAFAAGHHHDEPEETVVVEREPDCRVAAEPEPEPEPVAVEPEPIVAVEPEPVAAEPEPVVAVEPEPVVAGRARAVVAAEPEPVAVEPEPVAASAEPAWPSRAGVAGGARARCRRACRRRARARGRRACSPRRRRAPADLADRADSGARRRAGIDA